jgi:ankyrin repeat protein
MEIFFKSKSIAILQLGDKNRNALHIACISGDILIFEKMLLLKRSDINLGDVDGCTPLHLACANNNVTIMKALLKEPDIEADKKNKLGQTPFHVACLNCNIECIAMLLNMNQSMGYELFQQNTIDHQGNNVLHDVVCSHEHSEERLVVLKQLLESYAISEMIQVKNYNGKTALDLAKYCKMKTKELKDDEDLKPHALRVCNEMIKLLKDDEMNDVPIVEV